MDNTLLQNLAKRLKDYGQFMGSKWQNCEAEVIAMQTIGACAKNLTDHGEAMSWLSRSATSGRQMCGTNNSHGLGLLLADGSLIEESYDGPLTPPDNTAIDDKGNPRVLRVTDELLHYGMSLIKPKSK